MKMNEIKKIMVTSNVEISFNVGDKILVNFKVMNDDTRKKNYNFEGMVLAIRKNGINPTCTIRKISLGEGVEKTFFINNPNVNFIKVIKKGSLKKAKLYYLRKIKK